MMLQKIWRDNIWNEDTRYTWVSIMCMFCVLIFLVNDVILYWRHNHRVGLHFLHKLQNEKGIFSRYFCILSENFPVQTIILSILVLFYFIILNYKSNIYQFFKFTCISNVYRHHIFEKVTLNKNKWHKSFNYLLYHLL